MNTCKLKYTFAATNSRDALVQAGIIQSTEKNKILTLDSTAQEEINKQSSAARRNYGIDVPLYKIKRRDEVSYLEADTEAFLQIDEIRKGLGIFDSKEDIASYNRRVPATKLTTLADLEENKSFQNTVVEFVAEIPSDRNIPVAFRNVNKGEKFLFVKDLFQKKYNEKAWTSPAILRDGSKATPLVKDQFSSFDEFLTFALLHEKAHEYLFQDEGENIGQYEDRINQEALSKLPPKFTQGRLFKQKGSDLESSKASPETLAAFRTFLKRIGVNIDTLKQISVNGVKMNVNGLARINQSLIEVIEGKEDIALGEEAMHFAVEIIKQTNPALYNQLLKEINNYNILKVVFAEYGTDPDYQINGKPDVVKLKEEAIAKVLVETIIRRSEGNIEKPELSSRIRGFWDKIKDFLKTLFFVKSGFDKAAMNVLSGKNIGTVADIRAEEGKVFKQKTGDPQTDIYNLLKGNHDKTTPAEKELRPGKTEKVGYIIDGKEMGKRVTELSKDYYSQKFNNGDINEDEFEKAINSAYAETGTFLHDYQDYMLKNVFIDENGYVREEEGDDSEYIESLSETEQDAYLTLKSNLRDRIAAFGPENGKNETRFLSEIIVTNPKYGKLGIGGTIDFIAIQKDGTVNILDWKFMNLNIDKYADVPWFTVAAWKIQMDAYKNILIYSYGVSPNSFGQTRMIPIKATYSEKNKKIGAVPKLISIEIGDANVKNITKDYLLPVGIESERTGVDRVDKLLKSLNADYEQLSKTVAIGYSEKAKKAEQMNNLYSAMRKLQMQLDIIPLLEQAKVLNHYIEQSIKKYDTDWKGTDPMSYSDDVISNFAIELENYNISLNTYLTLNTALKELFSGTLDADQKELKQKLEDTVKEATYLKEDLKETIDKFGTEIIGPREKIFNLTDPDKVIRGFSKIFASTALLQSKGIQAFYLKEDRALTKAAQDNADQGKILVDIEERYEKLIKSKGWTNKNRFDIIKQKGKNKLINEFDPEFYKLLQEKIDAGDYAWIRANIDHEQFGKIIEERLQGKFQTIEDRARLNLTEEERLEAIDKEKAQIEKQYDITSDTGAGWLQYKLVKQAPIKSWESKEFKVLSEKGNEAAKDFYDYIIERNNYYQSIGYLGKEDAARLFLPWAEGGMIEKLALGGNIRLGETFLKGISIGANDIGFVNEDPRTGDPIHSVPIYFTSELDEEQASQELFKTMALYNQMAIRFKYMKDIEGQVLALVEIERNKEAINTSWFGNTRIKDGKLDYIKDNSKNTQLLKNMVSAILYNQKYIQDDNFDMVMATIGNWGETINKKLGVKIFAEGLAGRQITFNKTVSSLNNFFRLKTLGLSFLAPMSNLLGGTFQSLINAGTYMTKTDLLSAQAMMASKFMGVKTDEIKKFVGALDYFLPLIENYGRELANKLALNKFNGDNFQVALMKLMQLTDKNVQTVNFIAFLKNTIVINGEVKNVRTYLKTTPEYENMYEGSSSEREAKQLRYEDDVTKLIEEKGVMKVAQIINNEFVIPGIERSSDTVIELRRLIQQISSDALGTMSESQKRMLNLNIYGDSASMFRGWIPRLVDVRFGGIKYNSASKAYEWGRMRTFVRELSSRNFYSLSNLKTLLSGNVSDGGIVQMRKEYERKKKKYEKETGRQLDMTEAQFMDLYKKNVRSSVVDVIATTTFLALFFALKANAPDDDEDVRVKNTYKYMLRAADKFTDELFYFYDPRNINALLSGGIFPSIKLITDFETLMANFLKYNYGLITGADDGELKNIHMVKYLIKEFPGTYQISQYLPMVLPELSKELGINPQSTSGFAR